MGRDQKKFLYVRDCCTDGATETCCLDVIVPDSCVDDADICLDEELCHNGHGLCIENCNTNDDICQAFEYCGEDGFCKPSIKLWHSFFFFVLVI